MININAQLPINDPDSKSIFFPSILFFIFHSHGGARRGIEFETIIGSRWAYVRVIMLLDL